MEKYNQYIKETPIQLLFSLEQEAYVNGTFKNQNLIDFVNNNIIIDNNIEYKTTLINYANYFAKNIFLNPYRYVMKYVLETDNQFDIFKQIFELEPKLLLDIKLDDYIYSSSVPKMNFDLEIVYNILNNKLTKHDIKLDKELLHNFLFEMVTIKEKYSNKLMFMQSQNK